MKRFVFAVVALGGICAVQVATAATASAHAELVSSTPTDGAVLDSMPTVVELVFSENVGKPAALVVVAPNGDAVSAGDLQVIDDTMSLDLQPDGAEAGWFTISYQVTSADGHPISGESTFSVGDNTGALPPQTPKASTATTTKASPSVVVALVAGLTAALTVVFLVTRRWLLRPAPRSS